MLESDPDDLYASYLFDLAHICNCPAPIVGALSYADFLNYILNIDAYHKALAESVKE